jgi:hypothetical protein
MPQSYSAKTGTRGLFVLHNSNCDRTEYAARALLFNGRWRVYKQTADMLENTVRTSSHVDERVRNCGRRAAQVRAVVRMNERKVRMM